MASRSKDKLERIHQKFRKSVENGNFYEASQMIRTLYFRYKSQKKFEDAESLLYESIITLFTREQHESGVDLARLLVQCYKESEKEISDEAIDKLCRIIQLSQKNSTSRQDFIKEALSWTATEYKYGHPKLQLASANKYWAEKNYADARQHFTYTCDGTQCASFLIEYHVICGFPGEIDLFVTQAVLQFICLRNMPTANQVFFVYTDQHPGIRRKAQPYKQPLLNFVAFLLLTIETGTLEQFTVLLEQYKPSIDRDASYPQYLDKIGQLFFNLPPPPKRTGIEGMLGDLMESFFSTPENVQDSSVMDDVTSEALD